ncbi:3,4-dioxygenase subunit beta [Umezawaea tangerina]|uniref:Protocatechuate 3,4-dioxygenase beta subunit n=1 Tax=Umezawaea tangerina TaxID=84725 RepID=A0A2T0SXH8_9PSEU|nr:3,4-dioxygenase subunit beta [Umezawaea tangerina]PRY38099.1 protocatechuate 3,4-dioxygenase beta subunit [Umezawaea tangerina]
MSGHTPDHDRGLAFDLATLNRRRVLALFGGAGLATLVGCASGSTGAATATSGTTSAAASASATACATEIPDETAGPYPGDGTNGPNVLTESGIVRTDIRSSFGASSGTAQGVPLTIALTVQKDCKAYTGAAVYLWHCDRDGNYSMYSKGVTDQNYLRGVQEADADGKVTFTTVFPAAYSGRWPHAHFEVYPTLSEATRAGDPVKTTQLAFPKDVCDTVYATDGYTASIRNLASTSLDSDMVFADGHDTQLATVTGTPTTGYTATLLVTL